MSDMLGYTPDRVTTLTAMTEHAVAELELVDAAAVANGALDAGGSGALTALRCVCRDLRSVWLPRFHAIVGDTAMSMWDSAAPVTAGVFGPAAVPADGTTESDPIGEDELAAAVATIDDCMVRLANGDPTALIDLLTLLETYADDPAAMAAILEELGPEKFLDLLMYLSGSSATSSDAVTCAELLMTGMPFVDDPAMSGEALGKEAALRFTDTDTWPPVGESGKAHYGTPASVLAFLGQSGVMPPGYASTVALTVARFAMTREQFPHSDPPESSLPGAEGATEQDFIDDPVQASMMLLATDPDEARAFYADVAVSKYVFIEHDFSDDFTALFKSWAAACAGPDLTDGTATDEEIYQAKVIATQGAAFLSERPGYDPTKASDEASLAAAQICTVHMLALETAVLGPDIPVSAEAATDPELITVSHPATGDEPAEVAVIDEHGATLLVATAGASDEGLLRLRAASLAFYERSAAGTAAAMAEAKANGATPAELSDALNQAVDNAAEFDGFLLDTVSSHRRSDGRDEDETRRFWIETAASATRFAVGALPASKVLSVAVPIGAELIIGHIPSEEEKAVVDAGAAAAESERQLMVTFLLALSEVGLVDFPSPASGEAPESYEEFMATSVAYQKELFIALEHGTLGSGIQLSRTTVENGIHDGAACANTEHDPDGPCEVPDVANVADRRPQNLPMAAGVTGALTTCRSNLRRRSRRAESPR